MKKNTKKNQATESVSVDYQEVIKKLTFELIEHKKQINALFTMFYGYAQSQNFFSNPESTETTEKHIIGFQPKFYQNNE